MAQQMLFTFLFVEAIASDASSDGSCSVAGSVGVPRGPRGSPKASLLQIGRGQGSLDAEAGANESANLDLGYASSYHLTDWQDFGGGKIVYLDRQIVSCPTGAIQGFKLNRRGDQVNYNVKCSDELTWVNDNNVMSKKTEAIELGQYGGGEEGYLVDYWRLFMVDNDGKGNHVKCDPGYALRKFQLKTWHAPEDTTSDTVWNNFRNAFDTINVLNPKDEKKKSLMWYEYTCVQIIENKFYPHLVHDHTGETQYCQRCKYEAGFYLDRQHVFAPDNGLMTEFWSFPSGKPNSDFGTFNFEFYFAQRRWS